VSMGRRAGAIVVALLPVLPVQAGPAPSEFIPFRLTGGGAVIVPVSVDGGGPHPFLVDTGATHSTVTRGLAGRLGLAPVAKASIATSTGEELRFVVRLGRLSVGSATAQGILATVVDAERVSMDGTTVDGIVGQDFLSRFDYTIDYRRRLLSWRGEAMGGGGIRLALQPSEGRFLVDLHQPGASDRPYRFVPDSGANGLVVYERGEGTSLAMDPVRGRFEVQSSSGRRRMADMRRVRGLRIGSLTLPDQLAAVVSRPEDDAPEGDGLLPLHHFASVTFGGGGGYLVIQPR
jgi:predicted aspartyl protease